LARLRSKKAEDGRLTVIGKKGEKGRQLKKERTIAGNLRMGRQKKVTLNSNKGKEGNRDGVCGSKRQKKPRRGGVHRRSRGKLGRMWPTAPGVEIRSEEYVGVVRKKKEMVPSPTGNARPAHRRKAT